MRAGAVSRSPSDARGSIRSRAHPASAPPPKQQSRSPRMRESVPTTAANPDPARFPRRSTQTRPARPPGSHHQPPPPNTTGGDSSVRAPPPLPRRTSVPPPARSSTAPKLVHFCSLDVVAARRPRLTIIYTRAREPTVRLAAAGVPLVAWRNRRTWRTRADATRERSLERCRTDA